MRFQPASFGTMRVPGSSSVNVSATCAWDAVHTRTASRSPPAVQERVSPTRSGKVAGDKGKDVGVGRRASAVAEGCAWRTMPVGVERTRRVGVSATTAGGGDGEGEALGA